MPSSDGMATHLDSLLTLLVSPYQYERYHSNTFTDCIKSFHQ
jgi:hypothetical protein